MNNTLNRSWFCWNNMSSDCIKDNKSVSNKNTQKHQKTNKSNPIRLFIILTRLLSQSTIDVVQKIFVAILHGQIFLI
jgi:hypothetical protein